MEYTKRERPISKESAEKQFLLWLDAYDIDAYSFKESHPEEFKPIENTYNNIIAKIERGLLSITDDNNGGVIVTQCLTNGDPIVYKHMTCSHLIVRDKIEGHEMRKNALLAAMSGKPSSTFENMKWGVDAKTADTVYCFFLCDY